MAAIIGGCISRHTKQTQTQSLPFYTGFLSDFCCLTCLCFRVTCCPSFFVQGRAGARGDAEGSLAVLIVGWCDSRPPCDISCEEQLSIRYITFRHGTTENTSPQCKACHILCTFWHMCGQFLPTVRTLWTSPSGACYL